MFDRILTWLPLVALFAIMLAGRLRMLAVYRSGVRAVVVDLTRPFGQQAYDTLMIVVAIFWIYLLVAEAWPLSLAWLPGWLTAKVYDSLLMKVVGAALILAAPVLYAAGLHAMGMSWRIGIDQKKRGPFVSTGLFAWTRNPIYTAMDMLIIGTVLIHGRVIFLLLGVALVLLIHGIILREERFLTEQFGDEYRSYCQRVRRYGLV